MKRGAYVGDAGVLGGNSAPVIPLQSETIAHLSRFTSQPSETYRGALNELIFKLKRASLYTQFQDLWLFCADTQANSLLNIVAPSRDATITGAPTFTALRGFSGFNGSNYVSMPFSTSGLVHTSGFIWAGRVTLPGVQTLIMGDAEGRWGAVAAPNPGADGGGIAIGVSGSPNGAYPRTGGTVTCAVGQAQQTAITPGLAANGNGTSTLSAQTSPIKADNSFQQRLIAYGVLPAATAEQVRKVLAHLNVFFDDVGAYL